MNVVFMGYGELGANVLRGLTLRHRVVLVITHPAQFGGLNDLEVERTAVQLGLALVFSSTARETDLVRQIGEISADVIVSTNWRTRVPIEVLKLPRHGAVNVHDALLPNYAGIGAVNWAIRNGDAMTGLTAHYMDAELDTGPIITQKQVAIGAHDTAAHVPRTSSLNTSQSRSRHLSSCRRATAEPRKAPAGRFITESGSKTQGSGTPATGVSAVVDPKRVAVLQRQRNVDHLGDRVIPARAAGRA
jgi:methionyl-tRNA formyltransferase